MLGQNGSGKSTLVRLLSTLLLHDGGSAEVFGIDVVREARERCSGWSTGCRSRRRSSSACPPVENLSLLGPLLRPDAAADARAHPGDPRARRLPASTARGEPMEDLSRGMQQKIALARALLTSPVLLLLDEPTTGLDPRSKREVQAFIARSAPTARHARSCCAPTTWPRPRRWPTGWGSCTAGRLLCLDTPAEHPSTDTAPRRSRRRSSWPPPARSFEDEAETKRR